MVDRYKHLETHKRQFCRVQIQKNMEESGMLKIQKGLEINKAGGVLGMVKKKL